MCNPSDVALAIPGIDISSPIDHNPRIVSNPLGLAAASAITLPSSPVMTRGRRTRPPAPIYTAEVRHSNHSNKYNGFKVPALTDNRAYTSKVKPRLAPSFGSLSSAPSADDGIPPPIPVSTLQQIGINRCAIPEAELTNEALLALPDVSAPTTSGTPAVQNQEEGSSAHLQ